MVDINGSSCPCPPARTGYATRYRFIKLIFIKNLVKLSIAKISSHRSLVLSLGYLGYLWNR